MDDDAARAKIPYPADGQSVSMYVRETGETVTFSNRYELKRFKYNRYIRRYVQTVHSIDVNTGRLIDYLMENSLWRNTIVVYTSDQGFFLGEHGWFDKRFIYEESLRMPLLVHAPGVTPAHEERRVNTAMVCNVDFAPTFLELAGAPVPSYMQGRSIVPLLRGDDPPDWPMEVYHRYWMNQDDVHNAYAHYGIRTDRYKLIYWYNDDCGQPGANPGTDEPEWELFDLENDPLELRNCYHDPAYHQTRAGLLTRLNRKMAEIGDSPMHV
jgi:arylsulfatase A-like enzyme